MVSLPLSSLSLKEKKFPQTAGGYLPSGKQNKGRSKRQSQTAQGRGQLDLEATPREKIQSIPGAQGKNSWMQLTPGPQATLESSDILV